MVMEVKVMIGGGGSGSGGTGGGGGGSARDGRWLKWPGRVRSLVFGFAR